ncbi:hypothetical protein GBZ26_07455 [Azospirillum formosense]|uniref:Uncharacterized protein n=1 Tax=Azospirillum formosense TaxID=861533 RepID=A0ABX2KZS5_9PROT|nr:hypothetical protein [Azospirillum formosense]MBY3755884.1 hypothetical protein [Azospirillum formosense]NUB19048.1 hypothetical protein [Azospirillum formosense]
MMPTGDLAEVEHLHAELMNAIALALASGRHRDQELLFLFQWVHEVGQTEAMDHRVRPLSEAPDRTLEMNCRSVLRSLVCTPAHTPLGIAAKLAVACAMFDAFNVAQEAPEGPVAPHVILSAFFDAMAQAQLLPLERPSLSH